MNLLRVINTMDPAYGGPCQGIRNSIPQLQQLGVKNEVVTVDAIDSSFLGKDNFIIHSLGPAKGPWAYNISLYNWLIQNLERFDVVIVHGLWLYHGYAVRKAMKYLKSSSKKIPKVFVMPHGMLDPYFQKATGRKLKALRNKLYWKLIESKLVNNTDGILFTCEEELQLAKLSFTPYHPKKELNVGYGIIAPPAYAEKHKQAFENVCSSISNKNYLLFLSRIHEKKGVDILVKAYLHVLNSNQSKPIPDLVIAGPGLETEYGKQMQQFINDNNVLKDKIHFTGMLNGDAKWGAFYGCDAFVLPSHQENFGIAVAEAMACSKPVLITNKVNIWREIVNGKAGIVNDDTITGITTLLQKWVALAEDEKKELGVNSFKTYQTNFAIEHAALQLKNTIFAEA
jgi:glycosyltransferase involved in cell wall biosynthesis